MGYTTTFEGYFQLDKRLFDTEALYLLAFSGTRRMKRNADLLVAIPDPARNAVGLPLGEDGGYFVNQKGEPRSDESIVEYNRPPAGQPGLWCQWIPTANGGGIEWDGQEKFYKYVEWLQYLINHFLQPWGYELSGEVMWQGETASDRGQIIVEANTIVSPEGAEQLLQEAVSPLRVPLAVWRGLKAVKETGIPLYSYLQTCDRAAELGHPETVTWVRTNMEKYVVGLERGFDAIVEDDTDEDTYTIMDFKFF